MNPIDSRRKNLTKQKKCARRPAANVRIRQAFTAVPNPLWFFGKRGQNEGARGSRGQNRAHLPQIQIRLAYFQTFVKFFIIEQG